jgi:hypothetical protein
MNWRDKGDYASDSGTTPRIQGESALIFAPTIGGGWIISDLFRITLDWVEVGILLRERRGPKGMDTNEPG